MNETVVCHVKFDVYDVYCGRRVGQLADSIWGNPYTLVDFTREEAIAFYEKWMRTQPFLLAQLPSLKGKRLACWCRRAGMTCPPGQPCHVDVIVKLIAELCP